jgi:hypothetical protein
VIQKGEAVKAIVAMVDKAKTMKDLDLLLHEITYTVGGMVVHFDKEERSQMIISLTQTLGLAFQQTSKHVGEPSDIEMIVGSGKR